MAQPANFERSEQEFQQAAAAAQDAGVSDEIINSLAKTSSGSIPEQGRTEVPVTEVSQDVPVGDEFTTDFTNVPADQPIDNLTAAFSATTEITNPWIKQVVGERVNDPIIYNSKVNKIAAYEMQLNGLSAKEARVKANAALENNTLEGVLQEYKAQVAEQMEIDWKEYLRTADPEAIVSYVEFKRNHSLIEAYEGKLGSEELFVDTFGGLTLDEEREANEVIKNYTAGLLQEFVDDVGVVDWVKSGLGLLAPDYLKDVNDLVDVGLFSTKESYFNFIEGFKAATPDQKARIIDLYVPKVWEAFDENPIKAAGAINILFDEDHEASFWLDAGFDLADFTGIGFDVFKLGAGGYAASKLLNGVRGTKGISNLTNLKMKYRDLDNPSAATEVSAASKADQTGEVAKGNNQSKFDEATDANAVNTENTTVTQNSVDGLADAHTRLYESIKYNRKPSPFRENVLSQMERSRLEGLSRGVDALVKRHRSNITKLKADLAKEPKPKVRDVDPNSDYFPLLTKGWRIYNNSEGSVRLVQGTPKALRLQAELRNEMRKLASVSEQSRDIKAELKYADLVGNGDEARAINRGEIPAGAGEVVQKEADALHEVYRALTKNAEEAIAAGLTRESAQSLVSNIRSKTEQLKRSLDEIMPEMLTAAERRAVEDATIERLQAAGADAGKVIRSIDITDRTRAGFKAKITYEDGVHTEEVTFTENAIGDFGVKRSDITANLMQTWGAKIFSPEHQFDAADHSGRFGGLVRDATFGGDQASRIKRALNALGRNVTEGLSRKNREQLDRLVVASDEASTETGRLFTIKELQQGVETSKGTEIPHPDVIDSYFKMHVFLGEVKRLMDWSVRRSLEVKGFKNLNFVEKGTLRQAIVKPIDNWGNWNPAPKDKVMIYDEASETWTNKASADVIRDHERMKDEGFQLVEFFSKTVDSDGARVTHAFIPSDPRVSQVGKLPDSVLNETKGMYIPRVYKAGYYYVRDAADRRKPTILAFERRTDAENFIKKKNTPKKDASGNVLEKGKNYQVMQDGDMGYEDSLIALAQGYGGLYTSARKRENLKMVAAGKDPETDLTRPERLGGISSVQRYLDATGNMMPMAEQRIVAVKRWMNQVDEVARAQGYDRGLETPGDFNSRILLPENSAEKALFENMREFIRGAYGTLSGQEKDFQGLMTSVAEFMEKGFKYPIIGPASEGARKFAIGLAQVDVRRKLLGATFDAHLGWFNGAQLYVQGQNAALALSMHPVHGLKAIPEAMAARAIIMTSNDPELGELVSIVGKGVVSNESEFMQTIRAFRESGLYDSVMRVADYGGKVAGIGGTALDKFRASAKAGRVFYEEGELGSRLVSFFIAKEALKSRLGKKFNLNDKKIIKQLSDETYRIMMNMQKENAAWWQNHWLTSIPLQFAQVQAKLIENILPVALGGSKRWTAKEKMSVLGGQILLYGAVGVPLVEQVANYMTNVLGVEPRELKENNPQTLEFIQEGFTGVVTQALGLGNNFSDRGSIIKGMDDNALMKFAKGVYRTMKYKDDEVRLQDFLGASLNTFYRGSEAMGQLVESVDHIFYKPTGEVLMEEVGNVSSAFAAITSSWSNAQKANYLHNIGMHSGNGNLLIPKEFIDTNTQSAIARIMGFPYDQEIAYYNTTEAQKAHLRDWTYIRQSMKRRMLEQMRDPMDKDIFQRDMRHLAAPLTEIEYDKMMTRIIDETVSGQSGLDKQMKQQLRMHMSGRLEKSPLQGVE